MQGSTGGNDDVLGVANAYGALQRHDLWMSQEIPREVGKGTGGFKKKIDSQTRFTYTSDKSKVAGNRTTIT
jgi:hypothetical protein